MVSRGADQSREFYRPVFKQSYSFWWNAGQIDQRIDVFYERLAERSPTLTPGGRVSSIGEAASEYEALACEDAAVGVEAEVVADHRTAPL